MIATQGKISESSIWYRKHKSQNSGTNSVKYQITRSIHLNRTISLQIMNLYVEFFVSVKDVRTHNTSCTETWKLDQISRH